MKRATMLSAAALAVMGCATAQTPEEVSAFDQFRADFRAEALAAGVSPQTYDREIETVRINPVVTERNSNQPEFSRPVWAYLDSAVSDRRISDGILNVGNHDATFDRIEASYGVDREIIGAIWGLESSYGAIMGDHDILSSVATLAYDGRRQRYGRDQMIGALKIIDNGYARRDQLKGSWAGAMGQTQFIPTTYLAYAVDEDGDGTRDLWTTPLDVFASTANYLARSGYEADQPWGFEVRLPDGFNYGEANLGERKTVAEWMARGVSLPAGDLSTRADLNADASVIVPAGAGGPAIMVFDNFRAIMKYNNSTAYALGIGFLSDAIGGRAQPLSAEWPRDDRPLSLDERMALQQALKDRGYDPGPVDGIIGAGTKAALRAWQKDRGLPADGYASAKTLEAVQGG